MKAIKIVGWIFLSFVVCFSVPLLVWAHGYKLNPILVEISDKNSGWQMLVTVENENLIGADLDDGTIWLEQKGFRPSNHVPTEIVYDREKDLKKPRRKMLFKQVDADAVFIRKSSQLRYFCDVTYVVVLNEDKGKINQARGMVYETGCL